METFELSDYVTKYEEWIAKYEFYLAFLTEMIYNPE